MGKLHVAQLRSVTDLLKSNILSTTELGKKLTDPKQHVNTRFLTSTDRVAEYEEILKDYINFIYTNIYELEEKYYNTKIATPGVQNYRTCWAKYNNIAQSAERKTTT